MNSFFGEQVTSEMLGHDVPVLEHRVFYAGDKTGHRDPDVSMSFGVLADFAAFKFGQSTRALVRSFAFLVAILLLLVYATARFAAFWIFLAAFKAGEGVARFARFATSYTRALSRAVPRISSIFFVVCDDEILHHRKGFTAFAASEVQRNTPFSGYSFVKAVRTSARKTAVLPVFTRETGKWLLAIFTEFFDRHSKSPLFGDEGTLLLSVEEVK